MLNISRNKIPSAARPETGVSQEQIEYIYDRRPCQVNVSRRGSDGQLFYAEEEHEKEKRSILSSCLEDSNLCSNRVTS